MMQGGAVRGSQCHYLAFRAMSSGMKPIILEPKATECKGSVIFLHGLGDTAEGWDEMGQFFQQSIPKVRWVLPTAPMRKMTINGGMEQNSWYDILSIANPKENTYEGLEESREILEGLINEEIEKGVSPGNIVIGGFSQGAAIALHTSIQYRGILGGTMALSGFLPKEIPISQVTNVLSPFIMCHGRADQVIAFERAANSFKVLEGKYGIPGQFYPYKDMGHELIPPEIADITNFLHNRFGQ